MEINSEWGKPIKLNDLSNKPLTFKDGTGKNFIYHFNSDNTPTGPGCYVFYNQHGKKLSVLYIGQADNLKKRLEQQLNNLSLMLGIKRSLSGKKHLVYCKVAIRQGQKLQKVLDIVESNLIKTALSNGDQLLNKQGTKIKYDSIIFKGNRHSEKMFPRKMSVEK